MGHGAALIRSSVQCTGELAQIERESAERSPSNPFLRPSVPSLNRRHLESKLSSALALESADEYKQWLLTYCRQLSGSIVLSLLSAWLSILIYLLPPNEVWSRLEGSFAIRDTGRQAKHCIAQLATSQHEPPGKPLSRAEADP